MQACARRLCCAWPGRPGARPPPRRPRPGGGQGWLTSRRWPGPGKGRCLPPRPAPGSPSTPAGPRQPGRRRGRASWQWREAGSTGAAACRAPAAPAAAPPRLPAAHCGHIGPATVGLAAGRHARCTPAALLRCSSTPAPLPARLPEEPRLLRNRLRQLPHALRHGGAVGALQRCGSEQRAAVGMASWAHERGRRRQPRGRAPSLESSPDCHPPGKGSPLESEQAPWLPHSAALTLQHGVAQDAVGLFARRNGTAGRRRRRGRHCSGAGAAQTQGAGTSPDLLFSSTHSR